MSTPLDDAQLELLSAYVDRELDPAGEAEAEALLARSDAARSWVEEARADAAQLAALAPAVDREDLDEARRRAAATARVGAARADRPRSGWERLRAALTPARLTGLAVPALAILLAILAPHPATGPGGVPTVPTVGPEVASTRPPRVARATPAAPASGQPATTRAPGAPEPDDLSPVTVRSLGGAPARSLGELEAAPETLVVAMHLPEADVDLIWMMPPEGPRRRR